GSTVSTTAGVVVSSAFNITAGSAAKLAFTTQPGGRSEERRVGKERCVTLQDAAGKNVTGTAQNVTLAIQNNAGPGGVLSGITTVAVNPATGVAVFRRFITEKGVKTYTLPITGSTVSTTAGVVVSSAFNITAGSAAKLAFTTQPGG